MKRLILILLLLIGIAKGQVVPVQYVSIPDANLLPAMMPSGAFYKVARVYGSNIQTTYYFVNGTPTNPGSDYLATLHLNIISTYPGVTGYWSTEKDYSSAINTIWFEKMVQTGATHLISIVDVFKQDSILRVADSIRLVVEIANRKADSVAKNTVLSTKYTGTASQNKGLALVNNYNVTLSPFASSDGTAVGLDLQSRAQTAEGNLSSRIGNDSTKRVGNVSGLSARITADSNRVAANTGAIATKANQSQVTAISGRIATDSTRLVSGISGLSSRATSDSIRLINEIATARANEATKLNTTTAATTYQPIGTYGSGTVTLITKTDGYGYTSTITNPNTTPNIAGKVDTTAIVSKANLASQQALKLSISAAAATYQPIGPYLTANQTITLSGDASGTGATAIAVKIDSTKYRTVANSLTLAQLQTKLNGYIPSTRTINGLDLSANRIFTTDNIGEGTTNLYYTTARSRAALSGTNGLLYNSSTGIGQVDSTAYETVANLFPRADGRYAKIPNINSAVTRTINSSTFTVSTTRTAFVNYNVTISCTATIGSTASGSVALQYSTNSGASYVTVATVSNSNTVTLAVVLNSVQVSGIQLSGYVPANALVRLVPTTAGTTTITYLNGQETTF